MAKQGSCEESVAFIAGNWNQLQKPTSRKSGGCIATAQNIIQSMVLSCCRHCISYANHITKYMFLPDSN